MPCAAFVKLLAVMPVGALGALVSTLTVVEIETAFPTASVPVSVNW